MFPSSVEEGKLWPKAMAGVVRPARVPTTLRWLPPALPLLIQGALSRTYVAVYSLALRTEKVRAEDLTAYQRGRKCQQDSWVGCFQQREQCPERFG